MPRTARKGVCDVPRGGKVDQPPDNMEALESGSTIITWEWPLCHASRGRLWLDAMQH